MERGEKVLKKLSLGLVGYNANWYQEEKKYGKEKENAIGLRDWSDLREC